MGAREHHLPVTRRARYWSLGPETGPWSELWIVCHGYRQLAERFLGRFAALDDGERRIVAPEGLSRFYVDPSPVRHGPESRVGATWMTREDRENEIADYVEYLDRLVTTEMEKAAATPRLIALGFSQGVHTVSRWACLGETPVDRLILWGADLPADLSLEVHGIRLGRARPLFVVGERDPSHSPLMETRVAERMQRAGLDYEARRHPGGHEIDADLLVEIAQDLG